MNQLLSKIKQIKNSAFPDRLHIGIEPLLGIFEVQLVSDRNRLRPFRERHLDRGLGFEIIPGRLSAHSIDGLLTFR